MTAIYATVGAARHPNQDPRDEGTTLGDVLYANKANAPVSEKEWIGLVRSIAGGDQLALHALYAQTHRIVFTLIVRITSNRETAEELTLGIPRCVAEGVDIRSSQRVRRRMDHESGALESDRPVAVRTAEEARQHSGGQSTDRDGCEWPTGGVRRQRAGPPPTTCLAWAHAGRATGYRDGLLLRADVSRSGDTIESTPRNREDTHPFRTGKTPAGARRNVEGPMSPESIHHDREYLELVLLHALQALPASEVPVVEAHISGCAECRREWKLSVRSSPASSPGQPMCCVPQHR